MSFYRLKENQRTGRDNIIVEDARLIWKNFSGEETRFNKAGNRVFHILIDNPEFADDIKRLGWNVKEHEPKNEEDDVYFTLECTVSFKIRPPKIYLYSGNKRTPLDEGTVGELDYADMVNVDLVLNGSPWEVNGNKGVKAYVGELHVTIEQGEFGDKYDDYE